MSLRPASKQKYSRGLGALFGCLITLVILFTALPREQSVKAQALNKIFLPLVILPQPTTQSHEVLLGVYILSLANTQANIDKELTSLDAWTGKQTSLAGRFQDLTNSSSVQMGIPLELLWDNGYTSMINFMLPTWADLDDLNNGDLDADILAWAQAFEDWADQGGDRMAFIAPFPEMNITYNWWGGDPQAFKDAWDRVQQIFSQAGVQNDMVAWIFAPNGWTAPGDPPISAYYPGASKVDIVGFSSYNWGFCPGLPGDSWELGYDLYNPYVSILKALAPGKPIFIMQTATSSEYPSNGQFTPSKKDEWFLDVYPYIVENLSSIKAIMYFNVEPAGSCDWKFYTQGSLQYQGYADAVQDPGFIYVPPDQMKARFLP